MAPAFDANLGTVNNTASLTTSAAAAADTRIVVGVWWFATGGTMVGLNGGGLEWIVDAQYETASDDHHVGFASAYAPGGLVSGTVLTPVFSGAVTGPSLGASSYTGIKDGTSGYVDVVATGKDSFDEAWVTNNLVTTVADTLLVGISLGAAASGNSNTPSGSATEVHEFLTSSANESLVVEYDIKSSTGTYTLGGTWAQTSVLEQNIAVAYKAGTPSAIRTDTILVKPERAQGLTLTGGTAAWALGSYVDLFPAAEVDNDLVILGATWAYADFNIAGADSTKEWLIEIATGAASSEVTKIQIPWTVRWDTAVAHPLRTGFTHFLPEPFLVTAGTRVAVRVADADAGAITMNGFKVYYYFVPSAGVTASLIWQAAPSSLYGR